MISGVDPLDKWTVAFSASENSVGYFKFKKSYKCANDGEIGVILLVEEEADEGSEVDWVMWLNYF